LPQLPIIILLCAASGTAALIYEIIWFQLLELGLGSSAVSLAVVLATFMAGMCLGSLLLPRLVSTRRHPLRVYAAIELAIAVLALLLAQLIPTAGGAYFSSLLLRGIVAAVCLLPPTLLMGATLPALSRQVEGTPQSVSWLGFFYAANIAGAVFGCLLAGFYLLRKFDVSTATYVAVAINAAVAAIALALAAFHPNPQTPDTPTPQPSAQADRTIYVAIALSGLCALAAEAIWTRLLGLLFGASVYTLSIILAVFLVGLGLGSGLASLLCRTLTRPRLALGWCQLLLVPAIAWTAWTISGSLPYWPTNPSISSNIWFNFQLDLARAFWALLPPTILWGASFPFALAAVSDRHDNARLVARVYAANTLGAIVGALAATLLLISSIGSQRAEQLLIVLSAIAGLLLLAPRIHWLASASALLLAGLLIPTVPPLSKLLVAHGRYAATWVGKGDIIYAAEGMNSSVAVASFPNGILTFHVAGKIQASNVPRDMRLQRMLGHLSTLTAAHPHSVLVIGCGAGITAGAVSIDPQVERETIVEIEPLVPRAAAAYFKEPNFDVLHNRKVHVHIDDGRHYLLSTNERFDAITADPLDPWVKGAANLYTKEFLASARQHLNPGGVVTMYIQLFETNNDAVRSAVATFFDVFPNGAIWGNTYQGQGHDMILLGQTEPLRIDLDKMNQRITGKLAQSLAEIGMNSPVDLFSTYAGRKSDLAPWLKGAPINRDRNLRMQYLAGLGLNLDDSAAIYSGLVAFRRFPTNLFTSTEGRVDQLRRTAEMP
jgi:spermidine synthase